MVTMIYIVSNSLYRQKWPTADPFNVPNSMILFNMFYRQLYLWIDRIIEQL